MRGYVTCQSVLIEIILASIRKKKQLLPKCFTLQTAEVCFMFMSSPKHVIGAPTSKSSTPAQTPSLWGLCLLQHMAFPVCSVCQFPVTVATKYRWT